MDPARIGSYTHKVGTNEIAVVQNQNSSVAELSSNSIASITKDLPNFNPDKACVVALFKTKEKIFVLASNRPNPCVKEKTVDGTDYPAQLDTALGGALGGRSRFKAETLFLEALGGHLKDKLILTPEQLEKNETDKAPLEQANEFMSVVVKGILDNVGNTFAIHTDSQWSMKVITAISVQEIDKEAVGKINAASKLIASAKMTAGAKPWEMLEVELCEFGPVLESAAQTLDVADENEKAKKAYAEKKQLIFNDYPIGTFAKNQAFANL